MFGLCKPRKEFVSRLIDGQTFQFDKNRICECNDLGDIYSVFNGYYYMNFEKEIFYKKFRVIHRETEYFESDCVVDIVAYEKVNSSKERSYLVHSCYIENYYEWLNNLYDFKKDLAFQELIDFENYKRVVDMETSKKAYAELKKYYKDAKLYSGRLEEKASFIGLYESMMKAFKFTSNEGKVKFF